MTARAKHGFHAAWKPNASGQKQPSPIATRILWDLYPAHVQSWLSRRGGLKPNMVYLAGAELASMYTACPPQSAAVR